jgi:hypothetical protein
MTIGDLKDSKSNYAATVKCIMPLYFLGPTICDEASPLIFVGSSAEKCSFALDGDS